MAAEVDQLTEAFLRRRATSSTPPGFRIAVTAGSHAGFQRAFDGRELRIGKDPANHLCIPDPSVSRFHCVIERRARGLLLRDLDSTNGTQLGGHFIECAYLAPRVPFTIGKTTLQVLTGDAPTATPEPTAAQLLGQSPAIARLLASLPRVAASPVTVLIDGETGTGKSLLAEQIHKQGPNGGGPFVVVDCGAIPPSLIESELFGHEKGSFTGAIERRIGAFEAASGGTLFLDEIGELPLNLQPKLLRAIEERTIKRVGSTASLRIDTRVIAATNRDLRESVAAGQFRADLYYRLEAIRMHMPALRERLCDLPLLIEQFARRLQPGIGPDAIADLQRLLAGRKEWPGNVRELRNAVEKALVLGDLGSDETEATPLPPPAPMPAAFDGSVTFKMAKEEAMSAWEQAYLTSLIRHAKGNLSQAARTVQMDRSHLRDLLRRYHLASAGRELG